MKIQKVTDENRAKVYALLRCAFPGSEYEAALVQQFHNNGKPAYEWLCLHTNRAIGYIAFSKAYHGRSVCGLHLAPMAVTPEFQRQGVGSQLLKFALRQDPIKDLPLFVFGEPEFYKKFGFEPCIFPICSFDHDNAHFLSLRNTISTRFIVGYEPEFKAAEKALPSPVKEPPGKSRSQKNSKKRR